MGNPEKRDKIAARHPDNHCQRHDRHMTPETEATAPNDGTAPLGPILLLFATVLFGLSVRGGSLASLAALPATLVLFFVMYSTKRDAMARVESRPLEIRLFIGVLVFSALAIFGWAPSSFGPTSLALEVTPFLLWAALAMVVYLPTRELSVFSKSVVVAGGLALTLVAGVNHIAATEGVGIDVLFLHIEAADAIEQGLNPYSDAVSVPNGAPTAEPGDVIEGYVYPPVTAVSYAVGEWALSDPRYTSLAAWLVFLSVIGLTAARRTGRSGLLVFLLMASIPGWPLVLRAAWTEPLSLSFAAVAFAYWARPLVSGVFLGLTLGSKQYFAVVAPLLALFRDRLWLQRAIWALSVVVVTVGAAVALDVSAFWESAVAFHTSTPPRPDSVNLVGLLASFDVDWRPPSLLAIAVGLGTAIWAGIRNERRPHFFLAMAVTLAASFMVSSQAFANYWFLIFGLCGLGLLDLTADRDRARVGQPIESTRLGDLA